MNSKEAIQNYLFAERVKTNLITVSQMFLVAGECKGAEKSGAKKIIKMQISAVMQDLTFAGKVTSAPEFEAAVKILEKVDGMLDNDEFSDAERAVSEAIAQATTPAQMSWQVLSENGLI